MKSEVLVSWSGGIDSTALVANLLHRGYRVNAIRYTLYGDYFENRELSAISSLLPIMKELGEITFQSFDGSFLWNFSPDGKEIPRRNKRILDVMIDGIASPKGIYYLGLGEYIGAESWVVRNHVSASDADARSLSSYIYQEYGLQYRLLTLADFGESRFKDNRLRLGSDIIGGGMFLTSNCLENTPIHCGACYKCIERHVAFKRVFGADKTEYLQNPEKSPKLIEYVKQMGGNQ